MTLSSRDRWWRAIHLMALFNLAVAQPLYSVLSKYPEFFTFHHCDWLDVLVVAVSFSLIFPGLLVLSVRLAGVFGAPSGLRVHRFWIALLCGLLILQIFKIIQEPPLPGPFLLVLAMGAGVLIMLAYHFFAPVRAYFSFLGVAILICPVAFLFFSPVSRVLRSVETSTSAVSIQSKTPVVFLLFDEMNIMALMNKDHQIDPVRYPHWAALASQASWFRNDTTVNGETTISVPAMLTGRYPDVSVRKLPILANYPDNLFTLLKGSYDENVLEFVTRLCPEDIVGARARHESGAERFLSLLSDAGRISIQVLLPADTWYFTKNEDDILPDQLIRFQGYVHSIVSTKRPVLIFLHTKFPHHPFTFLPSGQEYEIVDGPNDIEGLPTRHGKAISVTTMNTLWSSDPWGVTQAHQREMLQIGLTDKLLGLFLAKLKSVGLYDQSLIIVTTDHGASFRTQDQFRQLTNTNYPDILPTPLFIKRPFQRRGEISERNVESIDIFPTIADVLGIKVPWQTDGRSVFDLSRPERTNKIYIDPDTQRYLVFPPVLPAKYETLDHTLAVFGSGTGLGTLYRIGPHPELIGKRVEECGPIRPSAARLELESPWVYENVNPEGQFVPARIKGSIRFPQGQRPDVPLAIAINGVIRAVTLTQGEEGTRQDFTAMVPPASYHPGHNNVAVYIISGPPQKPSLAVVGNRRSLTYRLTHAGGEERITSSEGQTYQVLKETPPGEVDVQVNHEVVEFRAWIGAAEGKIKPECPVVFLNGRSYSPEWLWDASSKINIPGSSFSQRSEFRFVCLRSVIQEPYSSALRIFVLTKDGTALELPFKY